MISYQWKWYFSGSQSAYFWNWETLQRVPFNGCIAWPFGFLQTTNVSSTMLGLCYSESFNILRGKDHKKLFWHISFCRNDEENQAFSNLLKLSRFPQVKYGRNNFTSLYIYMCKSGLVFYHLCQFSEKANAV